MHCSCPSSFTVSLCNQYKSSSLSKQKRCRSALIPLSCTSRSLMCSLTSPTPPTPPPASHPLSRNPAKSTTPHLTKRGTATLRMTHSMITTPTPSPSPHRMSMGCSHQARMVRCCSKQTTWCQIRLGKITTWALHLVSIPGLLYEFALTDSSRLKCVKPWSCVHQHAFAGVLCIECQRLLLVGIMVHCWQSAGGVVAAQGPSWTCPQSSRSYCR